MSQTFTLQGKSSVLSVDFSPPITLNPNYSYSIALIGFYTYHSIPNIIEKINNKFYYGANQYVLLPTGAYEISDIEKYLQDEMCTKNNVCSPGKESDIISLKPNNNTLKSEIKCKYDIDFQPKDTFATLLGFEHEVLKASTTHTSSLPVNINKVQTIRIECSICKGSYVQNMMCHNLAEFALNVPPVFMINVQPTNPIYLNVTNQHFIDNITIRVVDQDSQLVNFRGENIVVRLELRKNGIDF